jgi:glycosyltransferase involved in cell wall biosynthesis
MPTRSFLAVDGWHNWKDETGAWDVRLLKSAARSYGSDVVLMPESADLSTVPNLEVLAATPEVRNAYARTRILLVPSRWPEPYGRVILEAMSNAIPVICSGAGSMDEAADGAAMVVPDADDPHAWAAAIRSLDERGPYERFANLGLARAGRYELAAEVDKVSRVIARATTRRRT